MAKAKETSTEVQTKSVKKAPAKADAVVHPATLSIDAIKVIKGFNPRTELGDLKELKDSIKVNGILQPLLVRPGKKADTYDLVCGHKRLSAAIEAKLKTVPVLVREDLSDDAKALAAAMAENNQSTRTALNPLDEAEGFKTLLDKHSWSAEAVGRAVGCSGQRVRNALTLLDVPKAIRNKVRDGSLSASAAQEIGRLDPKVQKTVLESVDEETTAREIRSLANEVVRGANEGAEGEGDEVSASASTRGKKVTGDGTLAVWKGKAEVREKMEELVETIEGIEADGANAAEHKWALAALMWSCGVIDELDADSKAFTKAYKSLHDSIDWDTGSEDAEEEGADELPEDAADPMDDDSEDGESDDEEVDSEEEEEEEAPAPKAGKKGKKAPPPVDEDDGEADE